MADLKLIKQIFDLAYSLYKTDNQLQKRKQWNSIVLTESMLVRTITWTTYNQSDEYERSTSVKSMILYDHDIGCIDGIVLATNASNPNTFELTDQTDIVLDELLLLLKQKVLTHV